MKTRLSPNRSLPDAPVAPLGSPARRRWLGLMLALGVWLVLWPTAGGYASEPVALRVGDDALPVSAWVQMLRLRPGPRLLLELIDTALIRQAAAAAHLTLTPGEFALKRNQAVARAGSEQDLARRLQALGRTPAEYDDALRTDALLDRLALRSLKLGPAELQRYYMRHQAEFSHGEQVRGRLILLSSRENATAVAEALRAPGADFAGLARAFSDDPATRERGGDTGFFERQDLAAEISNVAFALKPGETSRVFAVPDGWALFKLEARRPAGALPFADVQGALRSRLELESLDAARAAWLRTARAQAKILIPDAALARQVRLLIAAAVPYEATNVTPELPTAPR